MATNHENAALTQPAPPPAERGGLRAFQAAVALRYLRRNWLSYLAILGVAISVMVLIVVMSVMVGFDEELRARIRGTLAHLIIESADHETFAEYEPLMRKVEALPDVVACAPHLDGPALIKVRKSYRWGQFSGVDLKLEAGATQIDEYWRAGMSERNYEQAGYILKLIREFARENGVEAPIEVVLARPDEALGADPKFPPDLRARFHERLKSYVNLALQTALKMRESDFLRLSKEDRALLLAQARAEGKDMREAWRKAEAMTPDWNQGNLMEDAREAPCIPGRDVIVVGRDLQGNEMSLDVGEEIVLVTPLGFDERSVKKCRIVGRFKSGMYEYDSRQVYLPLDATQKLLRKTGHVSAISVRLRDYGRAQEARAQILGTLTPRELADWRGALQGVRGRDVRVALPGGDSATAAALLDGVDRDLRKLRDEYQMWMVMGNPLAQQHHDRIAARLQALTVCLRSDQDTQRRADLKRAAAFDDLLKDRRAKGIGPAYRVWTWEDKRHNTLQAVWLERRILAIILSLLILVSGFVILSILHTTVMAKTKDIGILKAIGARVGGIMSVFLLNGFFIGVIGSVLGTLGGILLAANLNVIEDLLFLWFRFRVFPRDVYSLDKIPTAQDPTLMIAIVSVSAVVASFLAALYPAWRASRMDPVETLRYE